MQALRKRRSKRWRAFSDSSNNKILRFRVQGQGSEVRGQESKGVGFEDLRSLASSPGEGQILYKAKNLCFPYTELWAPVLCSI